jgi:hypothetical protein
MELKLRYESHHQCVGNSWSVVMFRIRQFLFIAALIIVSLAMVQCQESPSLASIEITNVLDGELRIANSESRLAALLGGVKVRDVAVSRDCR